MGTMDQGIERQGDVCGVKRWKANLLRWGSPIAAVGVLAQAGAAWAQSSGAVTAITAADVVAKGLTGTESLTAAVPSLVITNPANVGNPYLRGVGSNLFDPSSEQSVAMYIDGVYIAAPQSNIFNFNNIQQVEVLKGPQGTLFGRNAVGGVIQIQTRDPLQHFSGDASVGYGNYGDLTASGYITGPITDKLAGDLAVLYENQADGYGRDLTTGAKTFQEAIGNINLRSKLLFRPTETTRITLSGDYAHSVETSAYQKPPGVFSPIDGSTYPGPYNSNDDLNNRDDVKTGGVSLKVEQQLAGLHLTDIVAYRDTVVHYHLDDDVTAVPAADIVLNPKAHDFTEELQIASPDRSWLKWIVGAYYFNSSAGYYPVTIDGAEQIVDRQTSVSYAGFGQATATILPHTELTLGARYTTETQHYDLSFPATLHLAQTFDRWTYRASLAYHLTSDVLAYASFNTGFKTGGFNLLQPGNSFRPESLRAYEVGLKSELFDRRLRLNLDGFYYDDTNVQVLAAFLGGTITTNAAQAVIKGVEADFEAVPVDHLKLSGGLSVQSGRYTTYPNDVPIDPNGVSGAPVSVAGNHTVITPPVTANVSVSYTWDTRYALVQPSVTAIYNNGFFWQPDNRLTQPAYTLVNASLLLTPRNAPYNVRLWAKNLTDATYYIARLSVASVGDVQEQAAPRTYGVTLSAHF
jgi:iron complex outermembrane receptor protein